MAVQSCGPLGSGGGRILEEKRCISILQWLFSAMLSDFFPEPDFSSSAADMGAISKTRSPDAAVERMSARLDRLALASQAMWELLRDRYGVSEDELREKMAEIDLRDGRKDEAISITVLACPACGHKTNSKRPWCIVCGIPVAGKHVFEA